MRTEDKFRFHQLLKSAMAIYGKDLSADTMRAYWDALADYPIEAVEYGLTTHFTEGRFFPVPADIVGLVKKRMAKESNRPGVDEAWAMALKANDESETVIWTEEMAEAFAIAHPLLEEGDKIGARMAFKDAYNRITDGLFLPAKWTVSLGYDKRKQAEAIESAVQLGRLSSDAAAAYLPAPETAGPIAGLLTGTVQPEQVSESLQEKWRGIAEMLGRKKQAEVDARAEYQARFEAERQRRLEEAGVA